MSEATSGPTEQAEDAVSEVVAGRLLADATMACLLAGTLLDREGLLTDLRDELVERGVLDAGAAAEVETPQLAVLLTERILGQEVTKVVELLGGEMRTAIRSAGEADHPAAMPKLAHELARLNWLILTADSEWPAYRTQLLMTAGCGTDPDAPLLRLVRQMNDLVHDQNGGAYDEILALTGREPRPPYTTRRISQVFTALVDGLALRRCYDPESVDAELLANVIVSLLPALSRPARDAPTRPAEPLCGVEEARLVGAAVVRAHRLGSWEGLDAAAVAACDRRDHPLTAEQVTSVFPHPDLFALPIFDAATASLPRHAGPPLEAADHLARHLGRVLADDPELTARLLGARVRLLMLRGQGHVLPEVLRPRVLDRLARLFEQAMDFDELPRVPPLDLALDVVERVARTVAEHLGDERDDLGGYAARLAFTDLTVETWARHRR